MADELKFKLRMEEFQDAADRLAKYSKRDGETFMKEQIRGFIRHVLDFTPPSRGSTRGAKAKKLGEQAITADIRAVFRGVSDTKRADLDSIAQMRSVLKSRRKSGSMRVAAGGTKLKVPRALIAELIKAKKARVGYLASAWASAALSVGKIRIPAWVSRHSAPGNTEIRVKDDEISASISNAVEWASKVNGLRGRVNAALRAQTRSIEKRLLYYFANVKGKSGFD
ncbi:MAG: hypothetical protein ACO3RV_10055 [Luteolibacter sp.]